MADHLTALQVQEKSAAMGVDVQWGKDAGWGIIALRKTDGTNLTPEEANAAAAAMGLDAKGWQYGKNFPNVITFKPEEKTDDELKKAGDALKKFMSEKGYETGNPAGMKTPTYNHDPLSAVGQVERVVKLPLTTAPTGLADGQAAIDIEFTRERAISTEAALDTFMDGKSALSMRIPGTNYGIGFEGAEGNHWPNGKAMVVLNDVESGKWWRDISTPEFKPLAESLTKEIQANATDLANTSSSATPAQSGRVKQVEKDFNVQFKNINGQYVAQLPDANTANALKGALATLTEDAGAYSSTGQKVESWIPAKDMIKTSGAVVSVDPEFFSGNLHYGMLKGRQMFWEADPSKATLAQSPAIAKFKTTLDSGLKKAAVDKVNQFAAEADISAVAARAAAEDAKAAAARAEKSGKAVSGELAALQTTLDTAKAAEKTAQEALTAATKVTADAKKAKDAKDDKDTAAALKAAEEKEKPLKEALEKMQAAVKAAEDKMKDPVKKNAAATKTLAAVKKSADQADKEALAAEEAAKKANEIKTKVAAVKTTKEAQAEAGPAKKAAEAAKAAKENAEKAKEEAIKAAPVIPTDPSTTKQTVSTDPKTPAGGTAAPNTGGTGSAANKTGKPHEDTIMDVGGSTGNVVTDNTFGMLGGLGGMLLMMFMGMDPLMALIGALIMAVIGSAMGDGGKGFMGQLMPDMFGDKKSQGFAVQIEKDGAPAKTGGVPMDAKGKVTEAKDAAYMLTGKLVADPADASKKKFEVTGAHLMKDGKQTGQKMDIKNAPLVPVTPLKNKETGETSYIVTKDTDIAPLAADLNKAVAGSAPQPQSLAMLDKSKDNVLSQDELLALDKNRDGKLQRSELSEDQQKQFDELLKLDKNKDVPKDTKGQLSELDLGKLPKQTVGNQEVQGIALSK